MMYTVIGLTRRTLAVPSSVFLVAGPGPIGSARPGLADMDRFREVRWR